MHEALHTLGVHHEFTRYDRDNFVTIYKNNVIKGKLSCHHVQNHVEFSTWYECLGLEGNFKKRPFNQLDGETKYNIYSM